MRRIDGLFFLRPGEESYAEFNSARKCGRELQGPLEESRCGSYDGTHNLVCVVVTQDL
jgi:hypothetical protein